MKDGKIVLLHVFQDGLIFSGPADNYDAVPGVMNLYYFYTPIVGYEFQNIKDKRVRLVHDFDKYISLFSNPEIDVIVFHSLPFSNYYLFDYIDNRKIVVWWAWGYDIYYKQGRYSPLIALELMYMPKTLEYKKRHNQKSIGQLLFTLFKKSWRYSIHLLKHVNNHSSSLPRSRKSQDEILSRIDFFYAPLEIEYEFMKKAQSSFHAIYFPHPTLKREFKFTQHKALGNILINHSLTYTDNHLDVFEYLKSIEIGNERKYIIPVSYGIDGFNGDPKELIKNSTLNKTQTLWLTHSLPYAEYKEIIESASHAIYGTLRQQALGNIFLCLRTGVKVYLFKNSIVYRELKKIGYVCFTIENDLTTESLSKNLSERDATANFQLYMKRISEGDPETCLRFLQKAISNKVNENSN